MNANVVAMMIWEALQNREQVTVLTQKTQEVSQEIDKETERYFVQIKGQRYPISKGMALGAIKHGARLDTLPKKYKINQLTFTI